jgi:hypothetical protein
VFVEPVTVTSCPTVRASLDAVVLSEMVVEPE